MGTYKVSVKPSAQDAEPARVRLIESKTKAGAVVFVAKDTITAEEATTQDILDLGAKGVKLEKAAAES